MLPIETTTGAWSTTNTLAYRKLVGASATKGRAASQFSTKWTPAILEKAAAALERTDFPEEGFSGACHKKTPRSSKGYPGETSTSGCGGGCNCQLFYP